jgi:hypothetical protein
MGRMQLVLCELFPHGKKLFSPFRALSSTVSARCTLNSEGTAESNAIGSSSLGSSPILLPLQSTQEQPPTVAGVGADTGTANTSLSGLAGFSWSETWNTGAGALTF